MQLVEVVVVVVVVVVKSNSMSARASPGTWLVFYIHKVSDVRALLPLSGFQCHIY